ncbi:MAG: AraC family cel operon transcriptional repressor, partial [Yoonia sp.]
MTDLALRYRDILTGGASVHIARAQVTPARPKDLHGHDFFELFWVQNGQIRHHTPDGIKTLPEGSVGFMRPGDTHGLQGRGDHALVVSLTLHPSLIDALGKRHAALQGQFFWADAPKVLHLDMQAMLGLNQAAL